MAEETDNTLVKIKRVEGQIAGIRKMYEEKRECMEIVQQVVAARSALSGVARDLLSVEASRCARERDPEDFDRVLRSLIDLS